MLRRTLLQSAVALAAPAPRVLTVRGPVAAANLGTTLAHEHLFSNFGVDPAEPPVYDQDALLSTVVPYAESIRKLGAATIVDGTAAWFGRHPRLLRTISERTGLHILTNTGYYGAANDRYLPRHAYEESPGQLAQRWVREFRDGIGGTGIQPGFLKIGVDAGPLSEIDRKLVTAAALTHRQTGLVIAVHTGDNTLSVQQQLAILKAESVPPQSWIWVHANQCKETSAVCDAAASGAWVSLDGLDEKTLDRHLEHLQALRQRALLGHVLLSHDGNSLRTGGRNPMRTYSTLFTHFLPRLRAEGFSQADIRRLTIDNPARAFALRRV